MGQLDGKTAVVSGANRGLGRAVALGYAREGAGIVMICRKTPVELVDEIKGHGVRCDVFEYDLSNVRGIGSLVEAIADKVGVIDILVNNAGAQKRHDSTDFPLEDWEYVLAVNCTAVFYLCQAVGKTMLERGRGKIINMASLLSFQGGLRVPAYAASKGAVLTFSKALSNEWARKGINVNCIAPGYFDTDLNEALMADEVRQRQILERIPSGRWGRPDDIVGAAVFLASGASDYVNGTVITVDGGWMGR